MTHSVVHHSAGGLVYRQHLGQIDICMIKDSYGRWTFPKGHMEKGETLEETARREISEETGISEGVLQLRRELAEINYWFVSNFASDRGSSKEPVQVHKYVTYFLFEAPYDVELQAQPGEVQEITWVPLESLSQYNEYEDNIETIKKAKLFLESTYRNHSL